MGVDFTKVNGKISEEAAKAAARKKQIAFVKRWTPKVGKSKIRLMPPWASSGPNANQFWREMHSHWGVGRQGKEGGMSFTCPLKTPHINGTCEICNYVEAIRKSRNPADYELIKDIRAQPSYLSNIVNLDDPVWTPADVEEWKSKQNDPNRECPFEVGETKVQVWSYRSGILKELLDFFSSDVDITDFEKGYNLIVTREGTTVTDTRYRLRLDLQSTPFKLIGDLESAIVDLDALYPPPEPALVAQALQSVSGSPMASAGLPASQPVPMLNPAKHNIPTPITIVQDDPPECFKNPDVHSATNVECVGGTDAEGTKWNKCEYFDPCAVAVAGVLKPKRGGRKPANSSIPTNGDVDALEADLRKHLK